MNEYYFIWIGFPAIFFSAILFLYIMDKKANNVQMTIVKYQGHSYVGWKCGWGFGIVHDPDCKCLNGGIK